MQILRINSKYHLQSWYSEDYFELIRSHPDRYIRGLGFDITVKNLRTGEYFNHFNTVFDDVTNLNETKKYLRNLKIEKVLYG